MMNTPAPLPDKLRRLMDHALQMILPAATKAAGPVLVAFGSSEDAPSDKPVLFSRHFSESMEGLFRQLLEKPAPLTPEERKALRTQDSQKDLEARISKYSLMDKDLLEAQIAAERLSASLEAEFQFPTDCLGMRLEKLASNTFEREKNPLQVKHLTLLFRQSCEKLQPSKSTSDLAMKNWGGTLKASYGGWLETLNQTLIQQHVLPQLDKEDVEKRYRKKDQEKAREMRSKLISDITGIPRDGSAEVSDEELMQGIYAMLTEAMAKQPEIGKHIIQGNTHGAKTTKEDVLQTLQQLTVEAQINAETGYREMSDEEQTLAEQIATSTDLSDRAIDTETQNAISLLSMMFDKLQQEEQIADPIKPLLTELRVPVLQQAIADRHFFSDPDNPAQELVNEIAKAGAHWSPKENISRDPFYRKISGIVSEVSQSDGQDELLFDRKLQELKDFLEKEERRSALLEERIINAELAKARTEAAQAQALATVRDRITRRHATETPASFLLQNWVPVLFFHFNRDEAGHSAEQGSVMTVMDDLLSACLGDSNIDLDALLQEIVRHCQEIGHEIIDQPRTLAALRQTVTQARAAREAQEAQKAAATDNASPAEEPPAPAPPPREEKPAAVAPPPKPAPPPSEAIPPDGFDQQAATLRANTWLRFDSNDAGKIKVKLAAIIKHNGNYIFVNREGVKVITTDRPGVAARLRSGELCVVDDAVFFDRALESVIQTLRQ